MKNLQKGSTAVVLLVIVVIVLLGVIGWMYFKQPTQIKEISNSVPNNIQTETPNSNNSVAPKINQVTNTNNEIVNQQASVPSITIISPNGGELLSQNTAYSITWNYTGLSSSDSITVGFRTSNENVCWAGKTIATNKSYSFVPSQVKCDGSVSSLKGGGKFKAQLIVDKYADGRGVADTSDNYFTVLSQ